MKRLARIYQPVWIDELTPMPEDTRTRAPRNPIAEFWAEIKGVTGSYCVLMNRIGFRVAMLLKDDVNFSFASFFHSEHWYRVVRRPPSPAYLLVLW